MKGTISSKLEAVLRDPKGRDQLRGHLLASKDGSVRAGGKSYTLKISDVRVPSSDPNPPKDKKA
jgi:hypothetical protein